LKNKYKLAIIFWEEEEFLKLLLVKLKDGSGEFIDMTIIAT
jgi:hypothetical protein